MNDTWTVHTTPLEGLLLLEPKVFSDERGFFLETFREESLRRVGVDVRFVQENHSRSVRSTVRGLHYQTHPGQAKLVRVGRGSIWDVAVDIRPDSRTFGQWHAVELDDQSHHQLFIPVGFAHGFCVLSEVADVLYKVSQYYDPAAEAGVRWNDPELDISWPVDAPILSHRDQSAELFSAFRARVT